MAGLGLPAGARVERMDITSLHLAAGALTLDVGRAALTAVAVQADNPRRLLVGQAQLAALKLAGPLEVAAAANPAGGTWSLAPLAGAEGTIESDITDAHLLFDAHVTVPIHGGEVDFNRATVEHVGPDSRMGVSRMGLYVDAPNGRSYLYQFPATPVAGVEFERRGVLLGPWQAERGKLHLQEFAEGMLRQAAGVRGVGVTEQARLLLDRTSLTGFVQLGDGTLAVPGAQLALEGRAERRNLVRLHAEAVGRGVAAEVAAVSARSLAVAFGSLRAEGGQLSASVQLRLLVQERQLRFELEVPEATVSDLRIDLPGA